MQNPKSISELLKGGKRLSQLKAKTVARATVLSRVKAALPQRLADALVTAGIEGDRLTLGVTGAVWASRLRYLSVAAQQRVTASVGVDIKQIRVRVVPPIAQA